MLIWILALALVVLTLLVGLVAVEQLRRDRRPTPTPPLTAARVDEATRRLRR